MAALQCEICGGKLVGKPGGIFECDSCGMEYSTEWAKAKIQEIKGTVKVEGTVEVQGTVQVEGTANAESLLRRGYMLLEDKKWPDADGYFEKVLDSEPENARAYLGKLLAEKKLEKAPDLVELYDDFTVEKNWQKAVKFADSAFAEELSGIVTAQKNRIEAEVESLTPIRNLLNDPHCSVAIAASSGHTAGLKSDGTVVACGKNDKGECDVSGWRDIVAIAAGRSYTIGLKSDGSVVACGKNDKGQCDVSDWRDIVAIAAGRFHTIGLKSDGTVVACGENSHGQCNVFLWRDIVAISAGAWHTVGLKSDGTVVACGMNDFHRCNVSDWRDIVAIAAGSSYTIGLKADGTVVSCGLFLSMPEEKSGWRDIVAISGALHTVGLKSDGTAVACGNNDHGQCDVGSWHNVVAIAAGDEHTVGLRADGSVVACGDNDLFQCNVGGWKLFDGEADLEAVIEQHRITTVEKVAEKARQDKIAALTAERDAAKYEADNMLFGGKRKKELLARLAEIDAELKKLNG